MTAISALATLSLILLCIVTVAVKYTRPLLITIYPFLVKNFTRLTEIAKSITSFIKSFCICYYMLKIISWVKDFMSRPYRFIPKVITFFKDLISHPAFTRRFVSIYLFLFFLYCWWQPGDAKEQFVIFIAILLTYGILLFKNSHTRSGIESEIWFNTFSRFSLVTVIFVAPLVALNLIASILNADPDIYIFTSSTYSAIFISCAFALIEAFIQWVKSFNDKSASNGINYSTLMLFFTVPLYLSFKLDPTLTNMLAYNLDARPIEKTNLSYCKNNFFYEIEFEGARFVNHGDGVFAVFTIRNGKVFSERFRHSPPSSECKLCEVTWLR